MEAVTNRKSLLASIVKPKATKKEKSKTSLKKQLPKIFRFPDSSNANI